MLRKSAQNGLDSLFNFRGCEFDLNYGLIERVSQRSAESRGFNFLGYFSFLLQGMLTEVVLGSAL